MTAATAPTVETVKLYHPDFAGLVYGPDPQTAIKFGTRGQCEPHYAVVAADDPLLEDLLASDPAIKVIKDAGPTEVFVCPLDGVQFPAKTALLTHVERTADEAHGVLATLFAGKVVAARPIPATPTARTDEPPQGLAAFAAAKVRAKELGIDPVGMKLADLQAAIDKAETDAADAALAAQVEAAAAAAAAAGTETPA